MIHPQKILTLKSKHFNSDPEWKFNLRFRFHQLRINADSS